MTVYFIQDAGGDIKIGFSERDPMARLAAMQTGNPRELRLLAEIPGSRGIEAELHEKFATTRTRGEWFAPDQYLLGFIAGVSFLGRQESHLPTRSLSFGMDLDHLDRVVGAATGQALCDSAEAWCQMFGGNTGCRNDAELAEGELLLERARILLEATGEDDRKLGAISYAPVSYWESRLADLIDVIRERRSSK